MTFVANLFNRLFDLLAIPGRGHDAWTMLLLSVLGGLAMLLLFKVSTNQDLLARRKRELTGRIFESGLFQDHLGVLIGIQGDLAKANLRYLATTAPALLVLIPVIVVMMAQFESRFAHRPFLPGEATLVTATIDEGQEALLDRFELSCRSGVTVESAPVRDHDAGTVTWRVRVQRAGDHVLDLAAGDRKWTKLLAADGGLPRLAAKREQAGLHYLFLNPAETALPGDAPLRAIEIDLPKRHTRYFGFEAHWLLAFCVISLLFGLGVKDVFKVRI